jgi:methylenetetrahydrofolate reductase (NADPH)
VTFGAGGSTQQGTRDTVLEIIGEGQTPRRTCPASAARAPACAPSWKTIAQGIKRLVALRGDLPSGYGAWTRPPANSAMPMNWSSSSAPKPATGSTSKWRPIPRCTRRRSPQDDVQNFARKVKAGANSAITQYFYNADAYFRFVDDAAKLGATVPVIAGIMPITNYTQLMRFSDMCGTEIPRWIRLKLASWRRYGIDPAFGLDVVTQLCERLLAGGAPGLHFYSLNQAGPTEAIWQQLVK